MSRPKKLPSFQFYPGDWMKDPSLRAMSLEARGLWIDMLCLMFESPERGFLLMASGSPMTKTQLARIVGLDEFRLTEILTEMSTGGLSSIDHRGAIFCRRMVRDEVVRQKNAENGLKGGNPKLFRLTEITTPPLSPPEDEDEVEGIPLKGVQGETKNLSDFETAFELARKAYPGKKRGHETEWRHFLSKNKNRLEEIIPLLGPAIKNYSDLIVREKIEPRYIKHFQGWITQERWTDEIPIAKPEARRVPSF
jgi:hypothetical protein